MLTLVPRLRAALLLSCLFLLLPSVAWADGAVLPADIGLWPSLALLGCTIASYALRRFAPAGNFFHTGAGTLVISAVTAILSAIYPVIEAHGLSGKAIATAAIGAVLSLLATSNPSVPKGTATPMSSKPPSAAIALLVLLPFGLSACGFCSVPANKTTARCIAQSVTTDCAAPEVLKVVIEIAASVGAALASGDFSNLLSVIESDLAHRGIADAWGVITCAIQHISSTPSASLDHTVFNEHAKAWITAHPAKIKHAGAR